MSRVRVVSPLTPLAPREFFGRAWSGEGEWQPKPWLRWMPAPRRFHFHSATTWLTDAAWLVHDTTTWETGEVERRDFVAVLTGPSRIRLTGADMPGGCEIDLGADGYAFSPYVIRTRPRALPFPVLVRCSDVCRVERTGELVDTIDVSLAGVSMGRQVMRLHPEDAS